MCNFFKCHSASRRQLPVFSSARGRSSALPVIPKAVKCHKELLKYDSSLCVGTPAQEVRTALPRSQPKSLEKVPGHLLWQQMTAPPAAAQGQTAVTGSCMRKRALSALPSLILTCAIVPPESFLPRAAIPHIM